MGVIKVGYDPNAQGTINPFPEGTYQMAIRESKLKDAKSADKHPQLEVLCEAVASSTGQSVGKKTRMWFSFSPGSVPFFLRPLILASGIWFEEETTAGADGAEVPTLAFDPDHLIGVVFEVRCTGHEARQDGNGMREKWGYFAVSELNPNAGADDAGEATGGVSAPAAAAPPPRAAAAAAAPPRPAAATAPRPGAAPPRATVPGAARK